MKCYNHHNLDAVGVCKNCSKGICPDCAVDVGGGLACKNTCEEAVKNLNALIERNKGTYKKASGTYLRLSIVFALSGGFFIYYGEISDKSMAGLLDPIGVIFLIGTLFMLYTAFKFRGRN